MRMLCVYHEICEIFKIKYMLWNLIVHIEKKKKTHNIIAHNLNNLFPFPFQTWEIFQEFEK